MPRFFLNRQPPLPTRAPAHRRQPRNRGFISWAFFTESRVIYDGSGIDKCRFYRHTGSTLLTLVMGTNRSTAVGYKALGEPWETASGVFALPATRRHPAEKDICMRKMAPVWTDFSTSTQAATTTAMNLALNQAGYTQEDGSAIS